MRSAPALRRRPPRAPGSVTGRASPERASACCSVRPSSAIGRPVRAAGARLSPPPGVRLRERRRSISYGIFVRPPRSVNHRRAYRRAQPVPPLAKYRACPPPERQPGPTPYPAKPARSRSARPVVVQPVAGRPMAIRPVAARPMRIRPVAGRPMAIPTMAVRKPRSPADRSQRPVTWVARCSAGPTPVRTCRHPARLPRAAWPRRPAPAPTPPAVRPRPRAAPPRPPPSVLHRPGTARTGRASSRRRICRNPGWASAAASLDLPTHSHRRASIAPIEGRTPPRSVPVQVVLPAERVAVPRSPDRPRRPVRLIAEAPGAPGDHRDPWSAPLGGKRHPPGRHPGYRFRSHDATRTRRHTGERRVNLPSSRAPPRARRKT